MKLQFAVTVGSIAMASSVVTLAGAAPLSGKTVWNVSEPSVALRVDSGTEKSQQGGIVNERSTGNEPFMGPGASGGPTHSAPGATENTMKKQQRGMEQGGNRSEKSGAATAKADKQGSEESHGSSGSGSSKSGAGH